MREVKVYFTNGDSLVTSMSARLTDREIRDYYKIGRTFNVGSGPHDRMTKVKRVRILK